MSHKSLQRERKVLQRDDAVATVVCPGMRPRERIVVKARDLFHQPGIRGIGVDAIAEAAGTNKMTLYRHFGSKDELIVECLQKAIDEVRVGGGASGGAPP